MSNFPTLDQLIDEAKGRYVNPVAVADSEALGKVVAAWAEFDGTKILGAFLSALEDANMHGLREEIRQIVLERGLARPGDSVEIG
jgi:hypothetical protein